MPDNPNQNASDAAAEAAKKKVEEAQAKAEEAKQAIDKTLKQNEAEREEMREKAKEISAKARELSGADADELKRKAANKARELKDKAREAAEAKKQQAASLLKDKAEARKMQAARTVNDIKVAATEAADKLRERDRPVAAKAVEVSAQQLDKVTDYIEGHDVSELLSMGRRFARRNVGTFAITAFVGGLVAARFLRASAQRDNTSDFNAERYRKSTGSMTRSVGGRSTGNTRLPATQDDVTPPTAAGVHTLTGTQRTNRSVNRPEGASDIPAPVEADAAPSIRTSENDTVVVVDTDTSKHRTTGGAG